MRVRVCSGGQSDWNWITWVHEAACLFIDSSGPQRGERVSIGSVYTDLFQLRSSRVIRLGKNFSSSVLTWGELLHLRVIQAEDVIDPGSDVMPAHGLLGYWGRIYVDRHPPAAKQRAGYEKEGPFESFLGQVTALSGTVCLWNPQHGWSSGHRHGWICSVLGKYTVNWNEFKVSCKSFRSTQQLYQVWCPKAPFSFLKQL